MLKKRLIKYFVLLISVLVITSPFVAWQIQQPKLIHAVIVDKTVPDQTYREHKGLMWVLNNLKYLNRETKGSFQFNQDYYGFFPLPNHEYDIKDLPNTAKEVDLIYLADTYGVYTEDFYDENLRGNRSEWIYGGTDWEDIRFIKNAMTTETILIGEFNILQSPTGQTVSNELESMFQIKWSGWTGRYFTDLSSKNTEIPLWLINAYESQYKTEWNFSSPGFALVREDNTVIILQQDQEIGKNLNRIVFTPEALTEFKVKNNIGYYYWFDIVENTGDSEILANYKLDLTSQGRQILEQFGLKETFPAIVRSSSPYHSYYFAGDYSDNAKTPFLWKVSYLPIAKKWLAMDVEGDQGAFYWKVYYPLMQDILRKIPSFQ